MRLLRLAPVVFFLLPVPARAADVSMSVRDVPLHSARSLAASAPPQRFDLVGLHWQGPGSVDFRTRSTAGRWSGWRRAAPESEDLPDAGSAEAAASGRWRLGNPVWTGPARAIRYRVHGRVTRLRAYFLRSPTERLPLRRLALANAPPIVPRVAWGANEAIRRAAPAFAPAVRFAIVHHTAGVNAYGRAQSAAIVRGIEVYHVKGNGWNDIGYNFLVDRYGQVFEGRYGGVERPVIGAHAQGFNTGSVGIALIGSYGSTTPTKAQRDALAALISWRLDVAHVDPLSSLSWISGGNPRFPAGVPVFLHAVSGHRDTGFTDCPGSLLYAQLGSIARQANGVGLPKLYEPSVNGKLGALVRFRARLSAPLPWTVTISDARGGVVAGGSGLGATVDWTWDSSVVPSGRYGWSVSAGPLVRPAIGTLGGVAPPLAIKELKVAPARLSPNGDGKDDTATVSYRLTGAATVTATLTDTRGTTLTTLFSEAKLPGKQSFEFAPEGIPDGRYRIVLTATAPNGATATALGGVVVDRTLSAPLATSSAFSPNDDGRLDTIGFSFELAASAHVQVDVLRGKKLVTTLAAGDFPAGPQSLVWNGTTAGARVADGSYRALLTVATPVGRTDASLLFRVDTVPPALRALSFARLSFRVSEAAEVTAVLNGSRVVRHVRAGVFSLPARTATRRLTLVARDAAGNVSRTIRFTR